MTEVIVLLTNTFPWNVIQDKIRVFLFKSTRKS